VCFYLVCRDERQRSKSYNSSCRLTNITVKWVALFSFLGGPSFNLGTEIAPLTITAVFVFSPGKSFHKTSDHPAVPFFHAVLETTVTTIDEKRLCEKVFLNKRNLFIYRRYIWNLFPRSRTFTGYLAFI
jgi:hypothetical protein